MTKHYITYQGRYSKSMFNNGFFHAHLYMRYPHFLIKQLQSGKLTVTTYPVHPLPEPDTKFNIWMHTTG